MHDLLIALAFIGMVIAPAIVAAKAGSNPRTKATEQRFTSQQAPFSPICVVTSRSPNPITVPRPVLRLCVPLTLK